MLGPIMFTLLTTYLRRILKKYNVFYHKYADDIQGGGPRVVVSTAALYARVRGSVPGLGRLKETKNVSSPSTCESQYCGEPP